MSEELHDLVGAYAIDALPEPEAVAFELHLQTCASCQEELFRLSDAVVALAASSTTLDVEADTATVHELRSRWSVPNWAAVAAIAAGLVFGFWYAVTFGDDRVDEIAEAADVETVELTGDFGSVQVVLSNAEEGVALRDAELDPLPEPELYVLWVVRHDGEAPEFVGNITEFDDVDKAWDIPVNNVELLAISIEGAPSPETPSDRIVYTGQRTRS